MDYTVLLLVLILTTIQTTSLRHYCNSDEYSSAASSMADLQQLTTLQYCLIDNCTIIRIDTGQQLDIVYTTQSLLVVTPTDGQISLLISKNEPELFCSTYNHIKLYALSVILILLGLASSYIVGIHLIFKELRNTFGKLMMLYSIVRFYLFVNFFALLITHTIIVIQSRILCYLLFFLGMQFSMANGGFATCILAYIAYIMRHSYRCREVTKEINKKLYKYSIVYVLGSLLVFNIFIVSYDFGTGAFKHVILPNGHCSFINQTEYDTLKVLRANGFFNKSIQILMFVVYVIYYYKLNKMLTMVRDMANTDTRENRLLFKISITMLATIGISEISFIIYRFIYVTPILMVIGSVSLLIQQYVIMWLYACSGKTSRLCKEKFCTTETSP